MKAESLLDASDTEEVILVFWKGRWCLTPELAQESGTQT